MTNNYLSSLINEFDQEFESLVIPFSESYVITSVSENVDDDSQKITLSENDASLKLSKIKSLATQISAERYDSNYNPEICLANLLNFILSDDDQDMQNDFFQLLNQDHDVNLDQVLNDFDFYLNNPYKKKAEKILSKIEARKNK
ncbi:MAG: hypothetical protein MJ054_00945 [Clostridia bacterium]|nr:hypothetical protein [Clostridia bacterium]